MSTDLSRELTARLSELRTLCPEMRFGQMLAAIGVLADDTAGRSLWDIEDDDLVGVLERFRQDLLHHEQSLGSVSVE